jgi:hypothetical protein
LTIRGIKQTLLYARDHPGPPALALDLPWQPLALPFHSRTAFAPTVLHCRCTAAAELCLACCCGLRLMLAVMDSLNQIKLLNSARLYSDDLTEAMRAIASKGEPQFTKP